MCFLSDKRNWERWSHCLYSCSVKIETCRANDKPPRSITPMEAAKRRKKELTMLSISLALHLSPVSRSTPGLGCLTTRLPSHCHHGIPRRHDTTSVCRYVRIRCSLSPDRCLGLQEVVSKSSWGLSALVQVTLGGEMPHTTQESNSYGFGIITWDPTRHQAHTGQEGAVGAGQMLVQCLILSLCPSSNSVFPNLVWLAPKSLHSSRAPAPW